MGCIQATPGKNVRDVITSIAHKRYPSSVDYADAGVPGSTASSMDARDTVVPIAPSSNTPVSGPLDGVARSFTDSRETVVPIARHRKISHLPPFRKFPLAVLITASNNFSGHNVIGKDCTGHNSVYFGTLEEGRNIAIKRFGKQCWPNARYFADQATKVGELRHEKLVNLLGFSCDKEERILVAEYMPNSTLADHLYHCPLERTLVYAMCLRVAFHVAQALEYCANNGLATYHDLNIYRVLFDSEGDARLSCFGLVESSWEKSRRYRGADSTFSPPEYAIAQEVHPRSAIYSYGLLLLDLFRKQHLSPREHIEHLALVQPNIMRMMDSSHLEDMSVGDCVAIMHIVSWSMMENPSLRPEPYMIVSALRRLQQKIDMIPSWAMMELQQGKNVPLLTLSRTLGKACAKNDLDAAFKILVEIDYKYDVRPEEKISSEAWSHESMQEPLVFRNLGDRSFRQMEFQDAIAYYNQLVESVQEDEDPESHTTKAFLSATFFVRRGFAHLLLGQIKEARGDALKAGLLCPDWAPVYYIKALVLTVMNANDSAKDMLMKGVQLDT